MPLSSMSSGATLDIPGLGEARVSAQGLSGHIWRRPRANALVALPEPLREALRAVDPNFQYLRLSPHEPGLDPQLHLVALDEASAVERRTAQIRVKLPRPKDTRRLVVLWHDPASGFLRWVRPQATDGDQVTYEALVAARAMEDPPPLGMVAPGDALHFAAGQLATSVLPQGLIVLAVELGQATLHALETVICRRGYRLWHYTRASYMSKLPPGVGRHPLPDGFWDGGDRALGVIHGAFDRVALAFGSTHKRRGSLGDETLEVLTDRYGSRMFAFDHPTVSETPEQNAAYLVENLPDAPHPITLDLLCHSRGGLVARVLAGKKDELAEKNITIGKIIYVGTPNEGIRLVDPTNDAETLLAYIINLYLTICGDMADDDAVLSFKLLSCLLAYLGDELLEALPGIKVMLPHDQNAFLQALNAQVLLEQRHLAITADYAPPAHEASWVRRVDAVLDAFHDDLNDLVVPTKGVLGVDKPNRFHVRPGDALSIPAATGVWHLSYFGNEDVRAKIVEWLKA